MARTARQKIDKEIEDLKNTLNQLDLIDIYRILHPTGAEYTFLLSAYGTFSKICHILDHQVSLNK